MVLQVLRDTKAVKSSEVVPDLLNSRHAIDRIDVRKYPYNT